jgi:hypothetical protein
MYGAATSHATTPFLLYQYSKSDGNIHHDLMHAAMKFTTQFAALSNDIRYLLTHWLIVRVRHLT